MATTLTYNGIHLEMLRTREIKREAVPSEDGSEHGLIRWLFDVECIYHPLATSASASGQQSLGFAPATTDSGLLGKLLAKRKTLTYTHVGAGSSSPQPVILLQSPASGYATDAKNGPNPLHCDIIRLDSKTFRVHYVIECHTGACMERNPPAIIWHRWTESHDVDQQFLTTRTVQGQAQFRSDLLGVKAVPDVLRRELFHPIPPGFRRLAIKATATSDGLGLAYSFVDQEEMLKTGRNSPARKVEVYYTATGQLGGKERKSKLGAAMCMVRMWGDRSVTMEEMTRLSLKVAAAKMKENTVVFGESISVTQAYHQRFIELQATAMICPVANVPQEQIFDFVLNGLINDGQIPALVAGQGTPALYPPPPNDNATRGTYIGLVAAAALKSECDPHSRPENQ